MIFIAVYIDMTWSAYFASMNAAVIVLEIPQNEAAKINTGQIFAVSALQKYLYDANAPARPGTMMNIMAIPYSKEGFPSI